MNFILCGLPASGKTTIGKGLADKLKRSFIDTDSLIEKSYFESKGVKLHCREIFKQEGDLFFRALEKQQVFQLAFSAKSIISLGGGTLCDFESLQIVKKLGPIIYLKLPIEFAWERIQKNGIPAFLNPESPKQSFLQIAQGRLPFYENAAELIIETELLSEEEIIEMIIQETTVEDDKG